MTFFKREEPRYSSVPFSETDCDLEDAPRLQSTTRGRFCIIILLFSLLAILLLGFVSGIPNPYQSTILRNSKNVDFLHTKDCWNPAIRREWRTLGRLEQEGYIMAVKCLATKPSTFTNGSTLYDDFPWVHSKIGAKAHESATFLSWHRYFIHTYEQALKNECGYSGVLSYWDWTLDSSNLSLSPIFTPNSGFGGSSQSLSEEVSPSSVLDNKRCVTDGPFANQTLHYYHHQTGSHCLSRAFATGKRAAFLGDLLSPSSIEKIMQKETYFDFLIELEETAHNAIPSFIDADFFVSTAPNDPIFFLHHTQLDRLWYLWQHEGASEKRLWEYNGRKERDSEVPATLDDLLPLMGMVPDIPVRSVIDTQKGILCYEYR